MRERKKKTISILGQSENATVHPGEQGIVSSLLCRVPEGRPCADQRGQIINKVEGVGANEMKLASVNGAGGTAVAAVAHKDTENNDVVRHFAEKARTS